MRPPPRRRTTRRTNGVRAAWIPAVCPGPDGKSRARRAALPLSWGFLLTHTPPSWNVLHSPDGLHSPDVLPDALSPPQPRGCRPPVLGDLFLGGKFGTAREELEPGLVLLGDDRQPWGCGVGGAGREHLLDQAVFERV